MYGIIKGSFISNGEVDPNLGIEIMFSAVFFIGAFVIGNIFLGILTLITRPKK